MVGSENWQGGGGAAPGGAQRFSKHFAALFAETNSRKHSFAKPQLPRAVRSAWSGARFLTAPPERGKAPQTDANDTPNAKTLAAEPARAFVSGSGGATELTGPKRAFCGFSGVEALVAMASDSLEGRLEQLGGMAHRPRWGTPPKSHLTKEPGAQLGLQLISSGIRLRTQQHTPRKRGIAKLVKRGCTWSVGQVSYVLPKSGSGLGRVVVSAYGSAARFYADAHSATYAISKMELDAVPFEEGESEDTSSEVRLAPSLLRLCAPMLPMRTVGSLTAPWMAGGRFATHQLLLCLSTGAAPHHRAA